MAYRSLIVCDSEERYAEALGRYAAKSKVFSFEVQICTQLSSVMLLQKKMKIEFLFISGEFDVHERRKIKADKVFVLTDGRECKTNADEIPIYKYQSGKSIFSYLSEEMIYRGGITKKVVSVLGFGNRLNRLLFADKICRMQAKDGNVLLIELDGFGYGCEDETELSSRHTLADLLYYARQEQSKIGHLLPDMVVSKEIYDAVLPVRVSEDMKGVTSGEWQKLIEKIRKESIYEVIVLVVDENINDFYGVLDLCEEIFIQKDDYLQEKEILRFEQELFLLGKENTRRKINQ